MGFFQDLKQDLSQAVNDLTPDDKVKDTADFGVDSSLSTDDIFGDMDGALMGDLEAMLEKEVEALDSAPQEETPAFPEEAVMSEEMDIPEYTEDVLTSLEEQNVPEEAIPEVEIPEEIMGDSVEEVVEEPVVNEAVEELLDEVENILDQPEKDMEQVETWSEDAPAVPADISSETAIITDGMIITGDVSGNGSMEVYGEINGNIDIAGKLEISGQVNGNSVAAEVYADAAQINGEVKSKGSVKIGQNSVIIGNIEATSAVIAGAVKGDIDVHGPVILDSSAIVMGNIKSKSVQINNGAVIEGMCSQCYAEVSPSSFFNEVKKNKK